MEPKTFTFNTDEVWTILTQAAVTRAGLNVRVIHSELRMDCVPGSNPPKLSQMTITIGDPRGQ